MWLLLYQVLPAIFTSHPVGAGLGKGRMRVARPEGAISATQILNKGAGSGGERRSRCEEYLGEHVHRTC